MCEKEWITAPSPIDDAGADHHERLDGDVLAEGGVGGEIDGVGGDQGDAGLERWLAQPRLHDRFGLGELRLGVDAAHFVLAGFDHDRLQSHRAADGHGVDQIKLAFPVGVADPLQDLQRLAAIERHHAGIAQRDRAFRRRGIRLLADIDQPSVLDHQPAIAGGIGGAKAEHRDGGPVPQRRAQPRKCFRRDQRGIAEHDQKIVGAMQDGVAGRQHRMRGAEPLALDEGGRIGANAPGLVGDGGMVGSDHHGERRAGSSGAAPSTCASSDCPATGCSTFGIEDCIRVPSPAASTMVRLDRSFIQIPAIGARTTGSAPDCAAALLEGFCPPWKPDSTLDARGRFRMRAHFLLMFAP